MDLFLIDPEDLPFEERMKIKGGWPDEVSIANLSKACYSDDEEARKRLLTKLIELCKSGEIAYRGDIKGWRWGRTLYGDDSFIPVGTSKNPHNGTKGVPISSGDSWQDAVSNGDKWWAAPSECLIHKDEFKRYLETVNQWPASGLLGNWWFDDESITETKKSVRTIEDMNCKSRTVGDTASSKTAIPDNREPGRQEERQAYFRPIWEMFGKPKQNTRIWSELKNRSNRNDEDDSPIRDVFGLDEFSFRYEDGNIEKNTRKTFQNDMAAIRNKK